MKRIIVTAPSIPAPAVQATAQSQTTIALSASYAGIPFAGSYSFEYAAAPNGPFTVLPPQATPTFSDTTLSASQTRYYRSRILCQDGRITPYSSVMSATTAATPITGQLKFNPGFYGAFDYASGINATRFNGGDSGIISSVVTNPSIGVAPDNLMGFFLMLYWRSVDKGTSGPADDWSAVDMYANAIRAKKKQWWLWGRYDAYGGTGHSITTGTKCVPDWVITQSTGAYGNGNPGNVMGNYNPLGSGTFPKLYNAFAFNAYMDFVRRAAARYDSDPYFEGFVHGLGTAMPQFNGVDNLGTRYAQINYNGDFSNAGWVASYKTTMQQARAAFTTSNIWISMDYLFNEATSTSFAGQDVDLTSLFQTAIQYKCCVGGIDSWTKAWINPQNPFSATGQNAYASKTNPSYSRSVYADQILRGWRGPLPGSDRGFRDLVRSVACQELTEMGGYIGQFGPADIWSYRGPACDNVNYMIFDINYGGTGNYGINKAPNTLWFASPSYDTTYGQSVYRFIQGAGPTNPVDPYA